MNWIWPTTAEVPDKATVLTARQVSEDDSGDTEFANTCAAYEELSAEQKAEFGVSASCTTSPRRNC